MYITFANMNNDLSYEMERMPDAYNIIKLFYKDIDVDNDVKYMDWNTVEGRGKQRKDIDLEFMHGMGKVKLSCKFRAGFYGDSIRDIILETANIYKGERTPGSIEKSEADHCMYINDKHAIIYDAHKMRIVYESIKKYIDAVDFNKYNFKPGKSAGKYNTGLKKDELININISGKDYKVSLFRIYSKNPNTGATWLTESILFPVDFLKDFEIPYYVVNNYKTTPQITYINS